MGQRPHDMVQSAGFNRYEFLSVEFWDENPDGKWKIEFNNLNAKGSGDPVVLKEVEIRFRGSEGFSQEHPIVEDVVKEQGSKECVLHLDALIGTLCIYRLFRICDSL